ncbi:MAG: DUF3999 domain-containing protein [Pseudomonadota bacterium]
MIRGHWFLTLSLVSAVTFGAEPERAVTLDDFAYGYALETPGAASVYAVPLPVEVYRDLQRPDFGDLRVFNAQGQVVPHALLRPAPAKETAARVALPVFPVRGGDSAPGALSVRVNRDASGTIIDVRNDLPMVKDKPVVAYILDASRLDNALGKLHVQWPATQGFVATVTLSASNDLNYWRPVATATLAELVHGGERLARNTIEFAPSKSKYLRLTWNSPGAAVEISGVEAEPAARMQEPPPVWVTLDGHTETDKEGKAYFVFDSGGRFPVERANLLLADANSLVRASLSSRADDKAEWRPRGGGLFYRLSREGSAAEFRNDAMTVGGTADRFWRVDAAAENGTAPGVKLEIGWVPEQVIFLARGSGPYQLAYGSAVANGAEQPVAELLRTLDRGDTKVTPAAARLGQRVVLGGEDRLRPGPAPLPWRKILLWAVLVGGVALLAAMAMGLTRQMGKGE